MSSDGVNTYAYDVANRLTGMSSSATLSYDPLSRLSKTVGSATTQFLYDGTDLIAEFNGSGNLLRRYIHGAGSDEPIAWYEGSGTANRQWLLVNAQGSVVAVTNASGGAAAINTYDEYGLPGSGNVGRFQYTGQKWIPEIGMYDYKARIYSPGFGRFLQTDPVGYSDGPNWYAYVHGDPVNGRDPSGRECVWDPNSDGTTGGFDDYNDPDTGASTRTNLDGYDSNGACEHQGGTWVPRGVLQSIGYNQGAWMPGGGAPAYSYDASTQTLTALGFYGDNILRPLMCASPTIGGSVGIDAYDGVGGSVGTGLTFNPANGQLEIPISLGVGLGYGLDGKYGGAATLGSPSERDPLGTMGINANLGWAARGMSGSGSYQMMGSNAGSWSVNGGRAVGAAAFANVSINGSINVPPLYNLGC